ncbi:MAG: hypothetical protein CL609_03810 [Anaerolineaceae bacterium]|nr:hypothetical protein [Anaerolineaceae bacterium]
MNQRRMIAVFFLVSCLLVTAAGCAFLGNSEATPTLSIEASHTPSPSPKPSLTQTPAFTATPRHIDRETYPTPKIDPITPIPSPLHGLTVPDEVRLLVLLGSDNPAPFTSRTDAIMLAFYNPRLAKVALLSLPPEMFVYIPGYTMQRINVAYAIGGFDMLADTIQYNIGIRPDEYALVHKDDFAWFIEELNGINVDVLRYYYDVCDDIPAGDIHMDGGEALCYLQFREGLDIRDQAIRQQQIVYSVFQRLVQGGKLIELNTIYNTYRNTVQSNLSLEYLVQNIALGLRLGQPDRFGFFQYGLNAFQIWELPGAVKAQVLLPHEDLIRKLVQEAIDFTLIPVQTTDLILTLEYELTVSPTPTNTPTHTPTLTFTPTLTRTTTTQPTATITPGGPTLTPTNTVQGYPAQPTATTGGYP